jgi:chemotaxis family two-component system response regulator Rcp1
MHILLVEDNEHDIFFVREALKRIEHRIELSVVTDGAQALDFLSRREPYTQALLPTLILLDLNLPIKSGFDVLAALAHDVQLKCIPTIILTTSSRTEDITRCYELGANAYLEKPVGLENLFTLVRTIVEFWSGCKFRLLAHARPQLPG